MNFDLQTIWFILIGVLLIAYLITDGFDFGVGILYGFIPKNDIEKRVLLNSVGPVWDGNEVWLITAGAAVFAAFPEAYAALFSGLYIALFIVLVCLIFRACAFEFRSKEPSPGWRNFWDKALFIGSALPALLIGVAIGNVLGGLPIINSAIYGDYLSGFVYTEKFPINFLNLINPFTQHGFYGLLIGIAGFIFFILHGVSWLVWKVEGKLVDRAINIAKKLILPFIVLFILCAIVGYGISFKIGDPSKLSYLALPNNLLESLKPYIHGNIIVHALFRFPTIQTILIVLAIICTLLFYRHISTRNGKCAFADTALIAALGTLAGAFGAYPFLVPSSIGIEHSITVYNGSASTLTLTVMLLAALIFVPIVIAYQTWVYKMFLYKISVEELEKELKAEPDAEAY